MKFYQKHKKLSIWIMAFLFVAAIIIFREILASMPAIWGGIKTFLSIISPFIVGFAIAFVLYIPCVKIENLLKKTKPTCFINKHSRGISVSIIYILALAVIAVLLVLIIPWLVNSLISLYENREAYYKQLNDFIYSHCDENGTILGFEASRITEALRIENYISEISFEKLTSVANGVYKVGTTIVDAVLAIFSSVYMLASRDSLIHSVGRFLRLFISNDKVSELRRYLSKISGIFYTYIYSTIFDSLIVAVLMTIALLILGVDYAPLFGFAIGIANLVPIFGAVIAGVMVALFTAVTDGVWHALIVGAVILVIQQLDANVLQPRIIGKRVGVQPLYTLMAITIGGGLFGFWGIVLGVPIAATIQLVLSDIMDERERKLAQKTATAEGINDEPSEPKDTAPEDTEPEDTEPEVDAPEESTSEDKKED